MMDDTTSQNGFNRRKFMAGAAVTAAAVPLTSRAQGVPPDATRADPSRPGHLSRRAPEPPRPPRMPGLWI